MVRVDLRGRDDNRDKPLSVGGRLGLLLFFLFFFAMGSLFEILIVREFGRAIGQRLWKKVPCRIVSSDVQERNDRESPYVFTIGYQYEYGGRSYAGSTYKHNYSGSGKYSEARQLAQKYPAGANISCYVNPQNAVEAILKRDSPLIGLVVFFPLIFVAVGVGGIYLLWHQRPAAAAMQPMATVAIRKGGKSKYGKYGMAALFALFAAVGGGLLYPLGIKPIARTIDARSWVPTPCKVLRAEVRSHDSDDGTTYSVYMLYQYEFKGQVYKCDRYDFIGGSSSGYQGKARVVEMYETAAHPTCYVNPDNPWEAVLKRGFHASLLLALFPLPFLLVGVCGMVHVLRGKRVQDNQTAGPWAGRQPERASSDLTVLRVTDTGRAVLTPKFSPKMKFVGMTLVALFWNGITSIFLVGSIGNLRQGQVDGLGTLFLLPFVAIGLALIGGAVYQFLALFNPRPTLELSSSEIPLGGAAELRWSFTGQTSRIRELTVALRGVEEARYRRGTSTYTDKNVFYEMELYKTCDANQVAAGQAGFVMPQDTMHSFEAENNKIIWRLDVHGDIKGWPDVKESFRITVTPATA